MTASPQIDVVAPADITEGDVIEDPVGGRWLKVNEIQMLTDAHSFYGEGPDDRVTFEGDEVVNRRAPISVSCATFRDSRRSSTAGSME